MPRPGSHHHLYQHNQKHGRVHNKKHGRVHEQRARGKSERVSTSAMGLLSDFWLEVCPKDGAVRPERQQRLAIAVVLRRNPQRDHRKA